MIYGRLHLAYLHMLDVSWLIWEAGVTPLTSLTHQGLMEMNE